MSESQLVDGKTGELIGGQYSYANNGGYVNTTTSNYVPATTYYGTGSGAGQNVTYTTTTTNVPATYTTNTYGNTGYYQSGREYAVGGAVVPGNTTTVTNVTQGAQIVGTTVNTGKDVIKGESRIEYVPFEKKVIEYKDQAKVERVPKKVKKIEYREERKIEKIPKEVTVTDYYAVEYLRQYIPQYVPEKVIEYKQVAKKQVRYEYIPVERQIVHYPEQPLEATSTQAYQTQVIQGGSAVKGATYTTTQSSYPVGAVQGATYTTTQAYPATQQVTYTQSAYPTQNVTYTTGGNYVDQGYIVGGQTAATKVVTGEKLYSANVPVSTGGYTYTNAPIYENAETYVDQNGQVVYGGQYAPEGNYQYYEEYQNNGQRWLFFTIYHFIHYYSLLISWFTKIF